MHHLAYRCNCKYYNKKKRLLWVYTIGLPKCLVMLSGKFHRIFCEEMLLLKKKRTFTWSENADHVYQNVLLYSAANHIIRAIFIEFSVKKCFLLKEKNIYMIRIYWSCMCSHIFWFDGYFIFPCKTNCWMQVMWIVFKLWNWHIVKVSWTFLGLFMT